MTIPPPCVLSLHILHPAGKAESPDSVSPYLTDSIVVRPGLEVLGPGAGAYSLGFRAYRDINSGRQYGFVTCAHNLNVGAKITYFSDTDYMPVGEVKLLRLGGAYDVSFVALNSGVSSSNTITRTPYTLIPSNEEIDHPIWQTGLCKL